MTQLPASPAVPAAAALPPAASAEAAFGTSDASGAWDLQTILFIPYATLRSDDRGERVSRIRQIVEWLDKDFDGGIYVSAPGATVVENLAHAQRLELWGGDTFGSYGLFHDIISWKLRMFVPVATTGIGVLGQVMERYPVQRISKREVA